MTYSFRKRKNTVYYNEDHYFDTLGVFEEDILSSKTRLMDRLQDAIVQVHTCHTDLKPIYVMACIHLANALVQRYEITNRRFHKVLKQKMQDLVREPTISKRDRSLLSDYLSQPGTAPNFL